jgi:HK97 family phage prohead protease
MGNEAAQHELGDEWDGVLRRSLDIAVRSVDKDARTVDVVASTDTLDAHGDILEQDWDLKRYKKNPVVLWHHNRFSLGLVRAEDLLPIGHAKSVTVKGGELVARLFFETAETNVLADRIFRMFESGTLRAVSVGFRPGRVTEETRDGRTLFRLGDNELREISVVPIPSNPDAVAKSIEAERAQLSRLAIKAKDAEPSAVVVSPHENQMNEAEYKALSDAQVSQKLAETQLATANDRVKTLEKELSDEKSISAKLKSDLDAANAENTALKGSSAKIKLDSLQGKKFAPSERAELDKLVSEVGIERICKLLESRPDLTITAPVTVEGKDVSDVELPPEPVENENDARQDGGAELVKAALARVDAR